MLKLIGGVCEGTYLVKRAPIYLRAVINAKGEKDILDQIEDTPKRSEKVYVYKLEGEAGWIHLYGPKTKGYYAIGTYNYLPDVDGEALRDNVAWRKWAMDRDESESRQGFPA